MGLKDCKDYEMLKNNLTLTQLEIIDEKIKDYENYKRNNNNGEKDIIGEYINLYGSGNYTIDWYEGLIETDEFIKEMKGI